MMDMINLDTEKNIMLQPIEGDDPAGISLDGSEDLNSLMALASVFSTKEPSPADVEKVHQETEEILLTKSKDIRIASYRIVTSFIKGRYLGLSVALEAFKVLLDNQWDILHPRKVNRRRKSFEYIDSILSRRANLDGPMAEEMESLTRCFDMALWLKDFERVQFQVPEDQPQGERENTFLGALAQHSRELKERLDEVYASSPELEEKIEIEEDSDEVSLASILKQISEEKPVGEDPRLCKDAVHPYVQATEVFDLLISGRGNASEDWDVLVEHCLTSLRKQAKDIFVGTRLALALTKTQGFEGALLGLQICEGLLNEFGDLCFPRSAKGIQNAFLMLDSRLPLYLSQQSENPSRDTITDMLSSVESICETAKSLGCFQGQSSAFVAMPTLREKVAEMMPKDDPMIEVKTETVTTSSTSESGPTRSEREKIQPVRKESSGPPPNAAVAESELSLEQVEEYLVRLAHWLRAEDSRSPLPYRLLRFAVWGTLTALPSSKGPKTKIAVVRRQFDSLKSGSREPSVVIQTCEGLMSQNRYWLDLNRAIHEALVLLGEEYASAADAVALESVLFIQRLPGLEKMAFRDGTSFADGATRDWLSEQAARLMGGSGGENSQFGLAASQGVQKAFECEDLGEGLDSFNVWYRSTGLGPSKVHGILAASDILSSRNEHQIARNLLIALEDEMKRSGADMWAPDLCLKVRLQIVRCNNELQLALKKKNDDFSKQQKMLLAQSTHELTARIVGSDWRQTNLLMGTDS